MDSGLSEKINSFLSDPAAAEKVAAVAKTLGLQAGGNAGNMPQPVQSEQSSPASAPAVIPADSGDARRARLLAALRPMLREEKRGKLDRLPFCGFQEYRDLLRREVFLLPGHLCRQTYPMRRLNTAEAQHGFDKPP